MIYQDHRPRRSHQGTVDPLAPGVIQSPTNLLSSPHIILDFSTHTSNGSVHAHLFMFIITFTIADPPDHPACVRVLRARTHTRH